MSINKQLATQHDRLQSGRASPEQSETSKTSSELTQEDRRRVNAFFALMQAVYARQFDTAYSDQETVRRAKRFWAPEIFDLTKNNLDAGFARLRELKAQGDEKYAWPDVGEVIALCRQAPDAAGLPDPNSAYVEACRNAHRVTGAQWSHPAVYVAGRETGWFELRSREKRDIFKVFERNYKIASRRVAKGEQLDAEIPKAIDHNPSGTVHKPCYSPEKRREMSMAARDRCMPDLKAALGVE